MITLNKNSINQIFLTRHQYKARIKTIVYSIIRNYAEGEVICGSVVFNITWDLNGREWTEEQGEFDLIGEYHGD